MVTAHFGHPVIGFSLSNGFFTASSRLQPIFRTSGVGPGLPGNFTVDSIMSMKEHQKFDIDYFQDEDGFFTARVPAIPGCIASGKTLKETYKNTVDAIGSCLEARRKVGAMKLSKSRYAGVNAYKHTVHA